MCMSNDAFFTTFIEEHYEMHPVALHPLGLSRTDRRVLYRVDQASGQSWVLRAYPQDYAVPWWFGGGAACEWLLGQAATLIYLAQQNYPVPRVLPTRNGELSGMHEGWCSLMTSFIPGNMMENSLQNLRLLAAALGQLHELNPGIAHSAVAKSWWYPEQAFDRVLDQLISVANDIPPRWQALSAEFSNTLRVIQQCPNLPVTIIHGDCWPENALQTSEGRVMLLDWECAGLGMAVLDLAGLLIDCHPDPMPTRPIQADPHRIAAVVDGYCQHRILTTAEVAVLLEAMRFGVAFQAIIRFAWTQQEGWSDRIQRSLARLQTRFMACEEIAAIAQDQFEQFL